MRFRLSAPRAALAYAAGAAALAGACALPRGTSTAGPSRAVAGTPPAPAGAPSGGPTAPPAESGLTPSGHGARVYTAAAASDDRGTAPPDPLRVEIVDDARVLARKAKLPAPEADPRLDQAMYDLAHNLRGEEIPSSDAVDFLLAHYGITEPAPHLVTARATVGGDRQVREYVAAQIAETYRAGRIFRVGVGVDRTPTLLSVVVGLQERHVLVETVPRQLPRRGSVTLSGKLDAARYGDPHLIVTAPNGTVTDKGIPSKAGTFRGELVCTDDGRYQVEITATGKGGVAVLSNFPIYCGVPPPARAPGTAGMTPGQFLPGDAEKRMVDLLNRDRAAANLPALTLDRQLSDVARAHSAEMAEHDVVSHNSPRTGTTLDRVHHAGLNPELVSENVGRAYTAEQAETGFMASPGHRANIIDRQVKRVGVGVAFGKSVGDARPMFVTQLFTN